MESNLTENNMSQISMLLTPKQFFNLYKRLYESDEVICRIKDAAFIINSILMIVGIFGNIVSFFVFLQEKLIECKFNCYLLVVTSIKLIFCITLFIDYLFSKIHSEKIFLHDLNNISRIMIDFLIHTSDSCVALLTVYLSLDRLYAVKFPLKIKAFITNLHAKYLISVSLISLISFMALNVIICENTIIDAIHITYCTIISPTIINIIPLIIILVINILLVEDRVSYYRKQFRKSIVDMNGRESITMFEFKDFKQRASSVREESMRKFSAKKFSIAQKSHCTVIILADIWSVLTSLPYYILNSYFILFQINIFEIETIIITQIIVSIFFNSNHCINFFIYFSFYDDFRDVLKNFFLKFILPKKYDSPVTLV